MSRPGLGVGHVEKVAATEVARERLRCVLATLSGQMTVEQACTELSISPARFAQIRDEALSGAAQALEAKAAGRPAAPGPDAALEQARAEVARLKRELEASRIREEIALTMPHLVRPPQGGQKGGSAPKRDGRRGT
jgi:transposase-like protein